jgi:outer membrane receptor protein involved in Fe transport
MFDNNLAAALQSIPASMIKSIEVITSPGAQYDAQGTGGIINIILKENKAKGTNGNFSLSGGSRYENGSANIHVKRGSLDLSASLSGNMQLNTSTLNSYNRTSDSAGLNQNGYGSVQRNGYRAATGFDWAFTKKDDISGGLSYNNFGNVNNGSVTQNVITDYPIPVDTNTLRNTNNYFRYRSVDWNLNYKRKFENEGQELNLSYQESIANSVVDYQQVQYLNSGNYINYLYTGARGDNHQRPTDLYLTADYAHPFTKDIVLNTGLKGSFNHVGSNSGHYLLDTTFGNYYADLRQFDLFNYNRDIYAAYASITFAINKNYNMKIGLREEATHITYPDDSLAATTYFFLSPSGVISRTFKHNQTLKLSYSKRIQRPGFGQVNPFIDATDPANLSKGNPYLQPQKIDYLELQYYRFFEKGSNFMANLFYRFSNYDWEGYVTYYNSLPVGDTLYKNAGLSKTINAGTLQTGGLNLSGTIEATKKLEIRASTSLFEKYIQSDLQSANDQASFNYRFNTNIVYKFDKTLSAEFFYNYNSAHVEVQGKYPDYYYYNFAVRKQFLDNKASISFTTTNPFTHYTDQVSYIDGPNFSATSDRQYPNRVFTLSFNYKFGKIEYKEKKEEPAENTEQTENKDNS